MCSRNNSDMFGLISRNFDFVPFGALKMIVSMPEWYYENANPNKYKFKPGERWTHFDNAAKMAVMK